jgi:hypothetical protein
MQAKNTARTIGQFCVLSVGGVRASRARKKTLLSGILLGGHRASRAFTQLASTLRHGSLRLSLLGHGIDTVVPLCSWGSWFDGLVPVVHGKLSSDSFYLYQSVVMAVCSLYCATLDFFCYLFSPSHLCKVCFSPMPTRDQPPNQQPLISH